MSDVYVCMLYDIAADGQIIHLLAGSKFETAKHAMVHGGRNKKTYILIIFSDQGYSSKQLKPLS